MDYSLSVSQFLQDLLDSLFNILMQNTNSESCDNLVFDALVSIWSKLTKLITDQVNLLLVIVNITRYRSLFSMSGSDWFQHHVVVTARFTQAWNGLEMALNLKLPWEGRKIWQLYCTILTAVKNVDYNHILFSNYAWWPLAKDQAITRLMNIIVRRMC